jgi:predicted nucleic acid-binding protein
MMQTAYMDTSAFIKRFIVEVGTEEVEAFVAANEYRLAISSLTVTEFRSVLKRRVRLGTVSTEYARHAIEQLSIEIASNALAFQAVDGATFNLAGDLIEHLTSPLATLDAVHLASAKTARCTMLVTADKQLAKAAREADLHVLDMS